MRIQYASDLHLEYTKSQGPAYFATLLEPQPDVEVLILAGDIGFPEYGVTRAFLTWCCERWPLVVWVYGNHEYYNSWLKGVPNKITMSQKEEAGAAIAAALPNLRILHDDTLEVGDVTIIGSTFWTELRDKECTLVAESMSDFKAIRTEPEEFFTTDDWCALHWAARAFVEQALEEVATCGRTALVVTHHLPSYRMILPQYKGHPINCGFAARADALVDHPAVGAWICGHSHGQVSVGRCHLNARGYPREDSVDSYNPAACLEL
jgi:hypothetical protein